MDKRPFFSHLRCRECGRHYPKEAVHVCEFDFGPLEAAYDYDAILKGKGGVIDGVVFNVQLLHSETLS